MSVSNEIEHHHADLGDVVIHYVSAGRRDSEHVPVVMLHGYPETWFEWRHLFALLGERYHLIAPDLRGLGDSSRPLEGYDKRTVAGDIVRVLRDVLEVPRVHLVGHDWGGPTAFALAAWNPELVATLTIIDVVIPGDGGDFSQGGRRWHHQFHMTPDLPEVLTAGREREYLGWFYREFSWRPRAIDDDTVAEYLRTYTQPGAMRAGFSYYRNLPRDAQMNRELLDSGFRLPMPVLAIGGGKTQARGRADEPEASLRRVATNVRGHIIADSGHFVPEEAPGELAAVLGEFFAEHEGP